MMKRYASSAIIVLLTAGSVSTTVSAAPPSPLEKQYTDKITELLPGMSDPDITKRKDPQQALEIMCHQAGTPGKDAEREALCKAMIAKADASADVAKPGRIWLLRKLEPLGREEVVSGLTVLLNDSDADIRETARRALINNPSPKAGAALRTELSKADKPEWKIAMINGLAFRRDGEAVAAIAKLTADKDDAVANAAVHALGDIRTPAAIDAVTGLLKKARPSLQARLVEAALRCAEELVAKGSGEKAVAIYEQLYDKSQPENVRIAGLHGIAAARGTKALPMLFEILSGDDARMQMVAARSIQDIPGEEVTQKLLALLETAKPDTAELIIDVLGQRGPEALEAVGKLAREGKDPAARNTAVLALAQLGDPSATDLLWNIAKTTDNKNHRSVALRGYVKLIRTQGKPAERLVLLNNAMKVADGADDRRLILSAMGDIADPKALAPIMSLIDGDLHAEAFAAAVSVTKRIAGRNQTEALAALDQLGKAAKGDAEKDVIDSLRDAMTSYCVSWMVSGPYKEKGKEGLETFDVAFAPENAPGEAKPWQPLGPGNPDQPGRFDLGKGQNCSSYVRTTVISDSERKVQLAFGSDDAIKVWLNGELIHAKKVNRACSCDEDKVEATLKQGPNTLLIKVVQGGGDWAFCCAIRGTDGKPLTGLKYEAK